MSSKTQKDLGDFLGILADDVGTKEFVEEYQFLERQVARALHDGIEGDTDVRLVQFVLLAKVIHIAIGMGVDLEAFIKVVEATWLVSKVAEDLGKPPSDEVIH